MIDCTVCNDAYVVERALSGELFSCGDYVTADGIRRKTFSGLKSRRSGVSEYCENVAVWRFESWAANYFCGQCGILRVSGNKPKGIDSGVSFLPTGWKLPANYTSTASIRRIMRKQLNEWTTQTARLEP